MKHCSFTNKRQYYSRPQAEAAMVAQLVRYRHEDKVPLGSYVCPLCHYWHLTSKYDNRTPKTKRKFVNTQASWDLKKQRQEKAAMRAKWREQLLVAAGKPSGKPKRSKQVTLPLDKQKAAFATLHNKPAGPWLRCKDWVRKLFK